MRENLFRGKSLEDGEWVYGYLVAKIYGSHPIIVRSASMEDDCSIDFDYVHVDPATVGRFTNKKDRRGNRIFENDSVRFQRRFVHGGEIIKFGKVVYDEKFARFHISDEDGLACWDFYEVEEIEVFGSR